MDTPESESKRLGDRNLQTAKCDWALSTGGKTPDSGFYISRAHSGRSRKWYSISPAFGTYKTPSSSRLA